MNTHVFSLSKICSHFGITHAVICPGSRSAPLVFAFNRNPNIKTFVVVDERSAAYLALGIAQQLQKPVVLICTSGTAALNFYPAIAEAFYQKIPLVILTADRPEKLLNQQDGQMINQQNLYGNHIRAFLQLSTNNYQLSTEILAKSMLPVCGPVHLNIPLHEPLYELNEPDKIELLDFVNKSEIEFSNFQIPEFSNYKKKLILIGQLTPNKSITSSLITLSKQGFVILADVVSNQHQASSIKHFDFIISQADEETLKQLEPDLLISFGGPVVSKSLKLWLKRQKPAKHYRVQKDKTKVDTYSNVTDFIFADETDVILSLTKDEKGEVAYTNIWAELETKAESKIQQFNNLSTESSELKTINCILQNLPPNSILHVANSSPIRYVSLLGLPQNGIEVFSNRGVSGIDGCTSTAVGAALMTDKIVTLITGDLAFFYDRNAFWNKYVPKNLRVVLLNNSGGGIFSLIDGPSSQPELDEFFLTSHNLTAKNLAAEFGLEYYNCNTFDEVKLSLKTFFETSSTAKILEIKSSISENTKVFKQFKALKF